MEKQTTFDELPPDRDRGPTVLIIDDEKTGRARLELLCHEAQDASGLQLLYAANLKDAFEILSSTTAHVVLLDKVLRTDNGTDNGINAIPRIRSMQPHAQILVVTSSEDTNDAAEAMANGAFWFIPKQCSNQLILAQIKRAIEVSSLVLQKIESARTNTKGTIDLAGNSPAMMKLRQRLWAVAETNRPVLLLGETGTGKTTAAKLIHESRKSFLKQGHRPFMTVNMGAISQDLAERELFGHERGAYTDATDTQPGLFELANNGTLFLDEIGEASLSLQVKLLTVIEEGIFMRLGSGVERRSNFKLICATNRDLEAMVAAGKFREDLYMRISTFPIEIPTLKDRKDDIPDIIRSLLPRCCVQNNVTVTYEELPADFIEMLTSTPLRGNIRGIEQQMSRLLVFAQRDRNGRPILKGWQDIPGLALKRAYATTNRNALTVNELLNRPLDLLSEDFPGLEELLDRVGERIIRASMAKHRQLKDVATELKISRTKATMLKKRLFATPRPASEGATS